MVAQAAGAAAQARSTARVEACLHCGQRLSRGSEQGFCCSGCERVYELLQSGGLSRYYALRGDTALAPVSVDSGAERDRMWLDAMLEDAGPAEIRKLSLDVQGVQCTACVWLVDALFRREAGGYQCLLNPALGRLTLTVGSAFDVRHFVSTVESFGYRLGPNRKGAEADHGLMLRTAICAALAGNAMFLSATTYLGLESGPLFELIEQASFVIATFSVLIGGSYFFSRALSGLARGVMHLDLPIVVGMGLAYFGSCASLWLNASSSYLDTVSVFVALMLVGRLIQERMIARNRRLLLASDGASGLLARRIEAGKTALVPCGELARGDTLLVCSGEIVPVHARLLDAETVCSLDWINGESEPRAFAQGAELPAGAINTDDKAFRVQALAPFERSDLDLLLRDDARAKQTLRGDFWDRLARIYVALVLLATALGVGAWLWVGASWIQTLEVATAVLVVTCPCAFGIAAPFAIELAVSGLRRRGLFVRDGSFFDRAPRVRRIVFDKTGTLTTGSLVLDNPEALDVLSPALQRILYAMCARSGHPRSAAVARALEGRVAGLTLEAHATREVSGKGVELVSDQERYRFGDSAWATDSEMQEGALVFTVNGTVLAELVTSEVVRPDAIAEVEALVRDGYELWIASGDLPARVRAMAERLAIAEARALGGLRPEQKRSLLDSLDHEDTLFIGDGINDGPALSRAHVSGTPAIDRPFVPSRADFYFLTPGLAPLRLSLSVARKVRRVVKTALAFAVAYNIATVALAYAGLMRPWLAAVLMPLSSIAVVSFTAVALSSRRSLWRS